MVPVTFWTWVIHRVKSRHPEFQFYAEGYAGDPMGCLPNRSLQDLSQAGFAGYYDQDLYHELKEVVEGRQGVELLNGLFFRPDAQKYGVRYLENHDEVRCSHPSHFGRDLQNVAATAVAWLSGMGPLMMYNGQEVGEPALGAEGFSGDNARSSIFDYGCLPELQKWVNQQKYNGGGLSEAQSALRHRYNELLHLAKLPIFTNGFSYGLNYVNSELSARGIFVFARYTGGLYNHAALVVACLQEDTPSALQVQLSEGFLEALAFQSSGISAIGLLGTSTSRVKMNEHGASLNISMDHSVQVLKLIPISTPENP